MIRFDKIEVNPESGLSEGSLCECIGTSLTGNAEIIYEGRNRLYAVCCAGKKMVVKDFDRSLKPRVLYAFRRSKACKSFNNAITLLERGINTPQPIGFAEHRGIFRSLQCSFYVAGYDDSKSLGEYLDTGGEEALREFAAFMAMVHKSGVRHDDLNRTNVRVKLKGGVKPEFSLIDLNRMKIYTEGTEVPRVESFRNLCRFSCFDDGFRFFIAYYCGLRGFGRDAVAEAMDIKIGHDRRVDRKKCLKGILKRRRLKHERL